MVGYVFNIQWKKQQNNIYKRNIQKNLQNTKYKIWSPKYKVTRKYTKQTLKIITQYNERVKISKSQNTKFILQNMKYK